MTGGRRHRLLTPVISTWRQPSARSARACAPALACPLSACASGAFGVSTVTSGSNGASAATASPRESVSPWPLASTGSSTTGSCGCSARSAPITCAIARALAALPGMPTLTAATAILAVSARAWRSTSSGSTGCTA